MWARNCQESLFGFFCCFLAKIWKRYQFLTISSSLYINWNRQELLTFWKCSHFLAIPCLHIVSWELPGTCCIFGNSQEPLSFLTPVSGDSQPIEDLRRSHVEIFHQGYRWCELCNKKFSLNYDMRKHKENVHEGRYDCRMCKKDFSSQILLNYHV